MPRHSDITMLSPNRRLTVRLLRAGIITPSEAAHACQVSRQTIYRWTRGIDHATARARRVAHIYRLLRGTVWDTATRSDEIPGFEDMSRDPATAAPPPTPTQRFAYAGRHGGVILADGRTRWNKADGTPETDGEMAEREAHDKNSTKF